MTTIGNDTGFKIDDVILEYLKGTLDEDKKQSFLEWLDMDPANLKYYTEVKAVYNHLMVQRHLSLKNFRAELKRLNETIDGGKSWFRRNLRTLLSSAAASIAVLIVSGLLFCHYKDSNLVVYDTSDGRTEEIQLEDGTHVWLKGHSVLSFDSRRYLKKRNVNLVGEAVFDVTANPASPFVVNAPGVKVKVLGTVFHVSSFLEDGPAETVLAEGSVELYNSEGNYLVTLSPSQKAVYDSGTLQVKEVKVDDMAMMRYGLRIIRDASLQEIIRTIESEFNVRLHAVSYNSKDALFTISYIKDAKISDILDMVETVSGSKFEIQD